MAEISDDFLHALQRCAECDRESKPKKGLDEPHYMLYLSWYEIDEADSDEIAIDIHLQIRVGKENWITEAIEIEQEDWNIDKNHVGKTYALQRLAMKYPQLDKFINEECEQTGFAFFDHPGCELCS